MKHDVPWAIAPAVQGRMIGVPYAEGLDVNRMVLA